MIHRRYASRRLSSTSLDALMQRYYSVQYCFVSVQYSEFAFSCTVVINCLKAESDLPISFGSSGMCYYLAKWNALTHIWKIQLLLLPTAVLQWDNTRPWAAISQWLKHNAHSIASKKGTAISSEFVINAINKFRCVSRIAGTPQPRSVGGLICRPFAQHGSAWNVCLVS